jgi:hypothetical protein
MKVDLYIYIINNNNNNNQLFTSVMLGARFQVFFNKKKEYMDINIFFNIIKKLIEN